tara:strand:- start:313 stop:447 length:135 start_codon:yes stop_codon:yes gene_type:complete
LPRILNEALASFAAVFDRYTLANLILDPDALGPGYHVPDPLMSG